MLYSFGENGCMMTTTTETDVIRDASGRIIAPAQPQQPAPRPAGPWDRNGVVTH
jgi:hypothetical protein